MTRLPVVAATFVTLLTLLTLSVTFADSKTPPGQTSPGNTALPSISGTPAVGSTLQASTGSWQSRSISYSFQWQRCSSGSCAAISGGTGSSYLVSSADVGDSLRVSVTAKNKFGSTTATSAPTAVVPSPTPAPTSYTNTALPAVSGTAQAGQTLTVSNGSWSPTSSGFQYAWRRCQNGSCALSPTNANRASYNVQPGDVGYTIVAQVAPGGDWSQSANSKPTATVTTAPSTSGTLAFDGGAHSMTTLYSYETTAGDISTLKQGQSPNTWTCLCFNNNSMSLVADSRYGKAYKVAIGPGDRNPWNTSAPASNAAGQVTTRRTNNLGKWDWYAVSVRVDSWADLTTAWADLISVGYQTSSGDQVRLGLKNNNGSLYFEVSQNSGYANNSSGYATGSVNYTQPILPVTFGTWREFVVGIKWATDNTGAVEVYSRTPGGSWSKAFEKLNEPTYLYGTTSYGTFAKDGSNWPTVLDKLGLYYGYADKTKTTYPVETVYESGLSRSSDLATAQSTLP
jgi:Polysaccharide lyase